MAQFYVQDPAEKVEYQVNWQNGVPDGATIATSAWSTGTLNLSGTNVDGLFTVASLTGGLEGYRYVVENTITLSTGEIYKESLFIYFEKK
jgi:hypothetical protein